MRNRSLRTSIFLTGPNAESTSEFVYERFCEIASKFTGSDLGFFGWAEGDQIRLNRELMLEESATPAMTSAKMQLGKILEGKRSRYAALAKQEAWS